MHSPFPLRTRRLAGAALALPLLLTAAACGSDDDASSGAEPDAAASSASVSPTGSLPVTPDGDAEVVDEIGGAMGEEASADLDAALDAAGEDGLADALGQALVSVVGDAEDYSYADGRLTVTMSGSSVDSASDCAIATIARDGVGATSPITLAYDDGEVDCG